MAEVDSSMAVEVASKFEFSLPRELEASEPPESRGLSRDGVRLMVFRRSGGEITHARFHDLPQFLNKGDVLVVNASRTRNAALAVRGAEGTGLRMHLSTHLGDKAWTVELRSVDSAGKSRHFDGARAGEVLALPSGGSAALLGPYTSDCEASATPSPTLWLAELELPLPAEEYLALHGSPVRYNYVTRDWPLSTFQTVYATESGSAEMPSAGRPFTAELLQRLQIAGIRIAPLILHTGISNLDTHEPPTKEFFRLSDETARLVNEGRAAGGRVIAVGTTSVRALETMVDSSGATRAGEGWTCLVIASERKLQTVDGLLTGFHDPEATHLAILEALAGRAHIQSAYEEALQRRYLWHEFGDLHLILP